MLNACYVCCAMILFDVLAGTVAACKNHELSSGIMRDGLYNKVGELMLLLLAMFCNFVLEIEPFTEIGIPAEVAYSVVIYIASMEILSIIENICKINPELPFAKILMIFNIDVDSDDTDDVESNQAPRE